MKKEILRRYFIAVDEKDYETIEKYLRIGIKPSDTDERGNTALHKAAAKGDNRLILSLLTKFHFDINASNFNQSTPIHEAVLSHSASTVQLLIDSGADVNARDVNKTTALHKAVRRNLKCIVSALIKGGANLDAVNVFAHTPLSLAVLDVHDYGLSKLLLQAGASIYVQEPEHNMHLLHEAALNFTHGTDLAIITLLIRYGADPNRVDEISRNALHYVALNGSAELAQYFLSIDCNVDARDATNRTAYDVAKEHGNGAVCLLIAPHKSN